MTIRPVYERPRVLRTLLCLLVGVLALLWRAVPSFPWSPAACSSVPHYHEMEDYDYGYFCGAWFVSGSYPGDRLAMYCVLDGVAWLMCPGACFCCQTYMELQVYGDPRAPSHLVSACEWFTATINARGHCCYRDPEPLLRPGEWSLADAMTGDLLQFWWGQP